VHVAGSRVLGWTSVFALTACATGRTAHVVARSSDDAQRASAAVADARWVGPASVPLLLEPDEGARDLAALHAVFAFWRRPATVVPAVSLPGSSVAAREPLLAGDMERFARAAGLTAFAFHGTLDDVVFELRAGRPVLVGIGDGGETVDHQHFEVVVACDTDARRLRSLDPARGFVERTYGGFEDDWQAAHQLTLVMFATDGATDTPSSVSRSASDELPLPRVARARPAPDASPRHRAALPSEHVAQR
jgi:hypothetical protein